ncbi:hypothetical protein O159_18690 [Leifsonia xyli subsp. cynodontis DSM 46306]|uniref:Uncharacterized protein n=1 Tax=Leifsonia xyli subsp. cynodontis DSM 46306 TaxID=1389489 RepID=U3PB01_LEIXC|nr:penicillin acylase family protein [Leifsonia xyli]AGW41892.1 hypothetical protein O159_18690 [Leifsonia xyli subsp. cynodontis DSM 46306]
MPQITAQTADDLFRAQGYVHAQDRFWEMDFRRHVTAGRLSELFGASQVPTDTFIRTLGWRNIAEQEVELLDETSLRYYQDYADGVNAYLAGHRGGRRSPWSTRCSVCRTPDTPPRSGRRPTRSPG